MGNKNSLGVYVSKLFKGKKKKKLTMVGLDAGGKTTIFYQLKLDDLVTTIPTIGFNVETVDCGNLSFTSWDIGGEDKIRGLWRHYMQYSDSIIYVVDANDKERLSEARDELHQILKMRPYDHHPVLIFLNKQDLPNAYTANEFHDKFRMQEFYVKYKSTKFWIQPCSAIKGDGIAEGFDWLAHAAEFDENYKKLRKIWKSGWTVDTHDVFPKGFRKIVFSFLLVSVKKLEIPIEIFQNIICFLDPVDNEDFSEIKVLVGRGKGKKLFK